MEEIMNLYQQQFGNDFELGFELRAFSFLNDTSYSNDVSPSFTFTHNGEYFKLWVDHEFQEDREDENLRYAIIRYADEHFEEYDEMIHEVESPEEIIEILNSY